MFKTSHHLTCSVGLCLAGFFLSSAPAEEPLFAPDEKPWEAGWIACEGADASNTWLAFRKTIDVSDPAAAASARVACDSKYWLWINAEPVVFEGQLKRGPTRTSTYFDRLDLTGRFKRGQNTIAVLVWRFGRQGMSHDDPGKGGLLFEAQVGGQTVATDASWRSQVHPAYYQTDEPNPNWRLPESNVAFDARRALSGWQETVYDDSSWPAAIEAGEAGGDPWGSLVERSIPLWKDSGVVAYREAPATPFVSDGQPIKCTLPYNAQITPTLKVDADAGKTIRIQTDNYRGGGETNVRAEYITRAGEQSYESLGWMNGHEVIYDIPAGVRVLDLGYRETGYATELAGAFDCSDPRLNKLWKKAQRTLYLEMRDGYVDCPGRERAQWWGDITLELQQGFYALDRRSDRLSRKAIRELVAWQKPDGVLFSPIPAGNWDKELPMQMLASVGRYGFWEYYRHTGDRETIEAVYPGVNRYLDLWSIGDDGLVTQRKGGWTWGDWGKGQDMPLLYNAWYYLARDGRGRMARLLGDSRQADADEAACRQLAEAFNRSFWTDQGYRSPGHQGVTDDRGNALAVVSGIAPPERHATLRELLMSSRQASPYMEKYVLEALIQMQATDDALKRMKQRYGAMIDSPITTLWEGWGIGPEGYGGGSYNHAWSGGVLTLLSQYVAGVDPLEPGYARVAITPQLGALEHASATVVTPHGELRVRTERVVGGQRLELHAPAGVECVVTLPAGEIRELLVNGEVVGGVPSRGPIRRILPAGDHVIISR